MAVKQVTAGHRQGLGGRGAEAEAGEDHVHRS
jgi:hypothetical protein